MSKEKELKYIKYLEEKGYMIFDNIKDLKRILLDTIEVNELIEIIAKKLKEESECDSCGENKDVKL